MNKDQLYNKALEAYGFEAQSRMVDEECAELMLYVNIKETETPVMML